MPTASYTLVVVLSVLLGGCASRAACPAGALATPSRTPRFVVVRTDYSSSALALLDEDDQVIDDDWVDSGTRVSSLVTSLSGDVVLPSTPLGGVAWINRFAVDVLTIAGFDGRIEAQIDLLGEIDGTRDGYTSNPHDALRLADGRLLVSRHNPNPNAAASALAGGNDVVVVEGDVVTARIELHSDVGPVLGRPDVLLPLAAGSRRAVLVTLVRLDARYERAAPGAVLTLDEALVPSPLVTFGALQNCGAASVDPGDPSRVYVLCTGFAFLTEAERRGHAGIVELTLSTAGTLEITGMATPDETAPVPTNGLIALGGRRVLAVAYGSRLPAAPDRLVEIDVGAGTTREVLRTRAAAFALGEGTLDLRNGVALVPDAETSGILRIETTTATLRDTIPITGCLGIPPREIAPL